MNIFTDANLPKFPSGSVVTIGAYDGVHLGHKYLIKKAVEMARELSAVSVVVTFDRHPAAVVRPGSAPLLLSDPKQKLKYLEETGVDAVCIVTFDEDRAKESALDFVEEFLVGSLNVKKVVVGSDFHFGYKRQGNVELLTKLGTKHGFDVLGAPLRAESGSREVYSSTRIRALISEGNLEKASEYLGRKFELSGKVVHGDNRGGPELGYPTANISFSSLMVLPPDGVYAGWISLEGHGLHMSALSLGTRPTFYPEEGERLLEAFILEFGEDIYGSKATVYFGKKIRDQERFETIEELKAKISEDIDEVKRFCGSHSL